MYSLEPNRVLVAYAARVGSDHRAKILDEENLLLKNSIALDPLHFARKHIGDRESEISCQRVSADRRSIMKLDLSRQSAVAQLTLALESDDRIDKR